MQDNLLYPPQARSAQSDSDRERITRPGMSSVVRLIGSTDKRAAAPAAAAAVGDQTDVLPDETRTPHILRIHAATY